MTERAHIIKTIAQTEGELVLLNQARDRTNFQYVSLTNEMLQAHLEGKHVIGIYPLRKDEMTYFLAVN